jgi:hypothetical protein
MGCSTRHPCSATNCTSLIVGVGVGVGVGIGVVVCLDCREFWAISLETRRECANFPLAQCKLLTYSIDTCNRNGEACDRKINFRRIKDII